MSFAHRLLALLVVLASCQSGMAQWGDGRFNQQAGLNEARLELADAEKRLHLAAELQKRCGGGYSDILVEYRSAVAECRIRVELLTLLAIHHQHLRRNPEGKASRQEIERIQGLLKLFDKKSK